MSPRLAFSKATDCFRSKGSGKLTTRKATDFGRLFCLLFDTLQFVVILSKFNCFLK
jgi:hypothetical protein